MEEIICERCQNPVEWGDSWPEGWSTVQIKRRDDRGEDDDATFCFCSKVCENFWFTALVGCPLAAA